MIDRIGTLRAILDAVDGLSGETPVSGHTTANWFSGFATSGESGGDLVTFGANDTKYKILSLLVDLLRGGLIGTGIKIKLFMQVGGVETKVYEETFDATTEPCPWIVNGAVMIHEAVRVEVESDVIGDDAKDIYYDYTLEAL